MTRPAAPSDPRGAGRGSLRTSSRALEAPIRSDGKGPNKRDPGSPYSRTRASGRWRSESHSDQRVVIWGKAWDVLRSCASATRFIERATSGADLAHARLYAELLHLAVEVRPLDAQVAGRRPQVPPVRGQALQDVL